MTEARDDSALDRRTFLSAGLALAGAGLTQSSERAVAAGRAAESEINRSTDRFERYEAVVPDTLDLSERAKHRAEQGCRGAGFQRSHPAALSTRARRAILPVPVRGSTSTTRILGTM